MKLNSAKDGLWFVVCSLRGLLLPFCFLDDKIVHEISHISIGEEYFSSGKGEEIVNTRIGKGRQKNEKFDDGEQYRSARSSSASRKSRVRTNDLLRPPYIKCSTGSTMYNLY